jgi:hypothetical protein
MGILTGALEMTTFVIWQDLQSNSMWLEAPSFELSIVNTNFSTVVKSGKYSWQYFAPMILKKIREGGVRYSNLESDAVRWVLVVLGQLKAHEASHVIILQSKHTFIGRLLSWSSPTAIVPSKSIIQTWKVVLWGVFLSSEDG